MGYSARIEYDDGGVRGATGELLRWAARLIGELYPDEGFEGVAMHVEYVLATQPQEYRARSKPRPATTSARYPGEAKQIGLLAQLRVPTMPRCSRRRRWRG